MSVMKKRFLRRFGAVLGIYIICKLLGLSDNAIAPILIGGALGMIQPVITDYLQSLEDQVIQIGALQQVYVRMFEERIEKLEARFPTTESEA